MKTIQEINEKIKNGKAVVVTAEEIIDIVEHEGAERAARRVDVVTTGTFGPMCSSGTYFNVGHSKPKIKPLRGMNLSLDNNFSGHLGLMSVPLRNSVLATPRQKSTKRLGRTLVSSPFSWKLGRLPMIVPHILVSERSATFCSANYRGSRHFRARYSCLEKGLAP